MKIAVIGGGASGMMTAHLLNAQHDVTVFEKESMLGGNIRTLNKNVTKTSLNKNIVIDNGVIEFATDQFPFFVKMMDNLKVKLSSFPGNGSLFLSNGKYIFGRNYIKTEVKGILNKSKETFKLLTLLPDLLKLEISIKLKQKNIQEFTTGEIFKNKILHSWLRSLSMYAHSVPYKEINKNYPAELCIFIFKTFKFGTKWAGIQSGVYTYIEKILELFKGNIILSSKIEGIIRNDKGVKVQLESGEELSFDRIVFSTPPDQILKLLKDPTEQEKK
jgi:predicted NAD/FAD-binding protein